MNRYDWFCLVGFSLAFGVVCGFYYRSTVAGLIGVALVVISIYSHERRRVRF